MSEQELNYGASKIKVLKGLEPVQLRPGMYTNTNNPNHILEEVIDNAADEALAGFGKKIKLYIRQFGRECMNMFPIAVILPADTIYWKRPETLSSSLNSRNAS